MSNGIVCTPEELSLSISSNGVAMVCLTQAQRIGLGLATVSGYISFSAILWAFILLTFKAIRHSQLIQRPADVYMLSLFSSDLIMALGWMSDVRWVQEGKLYIGNYCTVQGIMKQLGITTVALSTLAIAIHVFLVMMWRRTYRLTIAYIAVSIIWLFPAVFIAITVSLNTRGSNLYETPVGFWCWIGDGSRYNAERLAGQYFWMWASLAISAFVYIALFFSFRGHLTVGSDHWWRIEFHRQRDIQIVDPDGQKRRSIRMVFYPLAYSILIIPYSSVRWISSFGAGSHHIPDAATFTTDFLFGLSGAVNVTLFLFTRSELLSLRDPPRATYKSGNGSSAL